MVASRDLVQSDIAGRPMFRQGGEMHACTQLVIKLMQCIGFSCVGTPVSMLERVTKDNYWSCLLALPRSLFEYKCCSLDQE